jgi:hypothetical protein
VSSLWTKDRSLVACQRSLVACATEPSEVCGQGTPDCCDGTRLVYWNTLSFRVTYSLTHTYMAPCDGGYATVSRTFSGTDDVLASQAPGECLAQASHQVDKQGPVETVCASTQTVISTAAFSLVLFRGPDSSVTPIPAFKSDSQIALVSVGEPLMFPQPGQAAVRLSWDASTQSFGVTIPDDTPDPVFPGFFAWKHFLRSWSAAFSDPYAPLGPSGFALSVDMEAQSSVTPSGDFSTSNRIAGTVSVEFVGLQACPTSNAPASPPLPAEVQAIIQQQMNGGGCEGCGQ